MLKANVHWGALSVLARLHVTSVDTGAPTNVTASAVRVESGATKTAAAHPTKHPLYECRPSAMAFRFGEARDDSRVEAKDPTAAMHARNGSPIARDPSRIFPDRVELRKMTCPTPLKEGSCSGSSALTILVPTEENRRSCRCFSSRESPVKRVNNAWLVRGVPDKDPSFLHGEHLASASDLCNIFVPALKRWLWQMISIAVRCRIAVSATPAEAFVR
jgi:hypothetical protein